MRRIISLLFLLTALSCIVLFPSQPLLSNPQSSGFDYQMAERTLDFLDFIKTEKDISAIKTYFLKNVAPTGGCQAIIQHWARFMKWDNQKFFNFIMEALGKIPCTHPIADDKGNPTHFGKRKSLWEFALNNTDILRRDIERLKKVQVKDKALREARKFLPENTKLEIDYYIVLFGASNAFAVDNKNGFDILQMTKLSDGTIDTQAVIHLFAHEIHHVGFLSHYRQTLNGIKNNDRIYLLSLMAAEGMPTFYIDQRKKRVLNGTLPELSNKKQLLKEWRDHLTNMKDLFREAEQDIMLNLEGNRKKKDILKKWMGGTQGPAYAVGAEMFSVIQKGLGLKEALKVVKDFRKFILIYNKAAHKLNQQGSEYFKFTDQLAERVAAFGK